MLILSLVALKFSQGQPDEVTQMISIDVSQLFNQLFTHPGGAITFTQGLPAYFKILENFVNLVQKSGRGETNPCQSK